MKKVNTTEVYEVSGNTVEAADASDFGSSFPTGTLTFTAGETTKTLTINVKGDTTGELDTGLKCALCEHARASPSSTAQTTLSTSVATGTIQNDDVSLSIAADNRSEERRVGKESGFRWLVTR